MNDGKGEFSVRPLPRLAQIAPGYGVSIDDFDADGDNDVVIVQNNYSPQRETGHMDGGTSLLLENDGQANLFVVWPDRSGIVIPGDAKSVIVTDINGNGVTDFVVGVNNGAWKCFTNQISVKGNRHSIELQGQKGNPTAIGARIQIKLSNGRSPVGEVNAGSGYLSQSSAVRTFAVPNGERITSITVRWPNGEESQFEEQTWPSRIVLKQNAI